MDDTSAGASAHIPALSLTNVNLTLGHGAGRVHILRDITFEVGHGEAVGLVGPSGSGKSTLLMVITGLERPDSGIVTVAGVEIGRLDEDALARFRGRQIGIVFQSFHLIPTMNALENVAVPLELAGRRDAFTRAAQELEAVGLGERLSHYPAELSGGEQQRVALARALVADPAILVADEPTGNLDETTGRRIIDVMFERFSSRAMTLILVTHDASLATRCDRVIRLRSRPLRRADRDPGGVAVTVLLDPGARPAHGDMAYGRTLRLALRDLRGGLRGFAVFISCIALGVGAIAAVGSFSRSLADGLAHQGREILGGDVAFTLIQRAATPSERTFMASRGALSAVATMRALVRGSEGRPALVELKAVDRAYPLYGAVVTEPAGSLSDLLASRDGAFGAVADPALLTRLGIAPGARLTLGEAPITITATLSAEPDKLADGIGFGPRLLISAEALQATGLLQPGSLVRWRYRLRLPAGSSEDAEAKAVMDAATDQFPQAGWEMRSRANAAPQLERSIERFTQYMALVGMTALLIGGIGVANSARHYLDRKRDVIATMKAIGATGTRIVTLYLIEVPGDRGNRDSNRCWLRGNAAACGHGRVRRSDPPAARPVDLSRRPRRRCSRRNADRRGVCVMAARSRP